MKEYQKIRVTDDQNVRRTEGGKKYFFFPLPLMLDVRFYQ
jgi:hypothetical protein